MEGQGGDFNDVVETLASMFGAVISKEVILAVVESCDGDLNSAAEAVMSMSSYAENATNAVVNQPQVKHDQPHEPVSVTTTYTAQQVTTCDFQVTTQPAMSYAGASSSSGTLPKQAPRSRPPPPPEVMVWTDQLRQIMSYHNKGARILILMRGVPGSGKSYLAKQIVEMIIGASYTDYKTHICSTDDFFMFRGQYHYEKCKLSEAHDWNQNRVRKALRHGLSPIIIDNTNIEIWEMEPYVREGVKNGYIIEVVEPNTPWAKKVGLLMRRNIHNVPATTIKRMLNNYQDGITGNILMRYYGLSYPADKVPPVTRNMPEYVPPQPAEQPRHIAIAQSDVVKTGDAVIRHNEGRQQEENAVEAQIPEGTQTQMDVAGYVPADRIIPIEVESEGEEEARQQRYIEIQKQLEEIEKVDEEWENNEGWGDELRETVSSGSGNEIFAPLDPRPQRRTTSEGSSQSTPRDLLDSVQKCDDWRQISMFMPTWADDSSTQKDECIDSSPRETKTTGTCMQAGDTNINTPGKKIIIATPRDINKFFIPSKNEKIPAVRMLDKSSITNELLITEAYRCKNEEQHFAAFRKLFKTIPRALLRDVFDKCCGDVNWAVDIVLGHIASNQLQIVEYNISDTEEEDMKLEQCNCLAKYQLIPDEEPKPLTANIHADEQNIPTISNKSNLPQKKTKHLPADKTLQLKHEIEKNIVISDDYYSPHTLKIRKMRRGEDISEPQPSTSKGAMEENSEQIKDEASFFSDGEESNTSSLDDIERTVNVNVGFEFVTQLDNLFGRRGMAYPDNIDPKINIPISLLNEINAFWMESLMCQLDERDKQTAKMIKEDADFARQLELKEAELAQQGKEPEVPDFKEIMDMDFAISLYQKDVAEWKTKEPTDLAAKLSRDKLYNLFPEVNPNILSELLMAHDNNFQATVEVLLMSTGKANILEEENGLNKFVMEKEMERQEKLLEEEKKALAEVEWPLLPMTGETVDFDVVNKYREDADKHLARRNLNYQKAQDYIRRGMTQVANYYSDVANFHKQKYEQANSMAAASLMQVHALKTPDNATIDLHYLRVGEAKESLDLFLDTHIQQLKEGNYKGVRSHTLFFITGRGLHSNGRPRVKPAVKKRLRERGLVFSERNPGLLTAKVTAEDKLSYQVQVP